VPLVVSLLERGFGWPGPADLDSRLDRTALVELHGAVVGTLFIHRDSDDEASIFGFVIDPSRQGRGIGRAALRRACEGLHDAGARRISLDVDLTNDRALALYTSLGFTPVTTEDYLTLPLG
jgi:ribosomal protein S18 acetylase RimI-like enzyme